MMVAAHPCEVFKPLRFQREPILRSPFLVLSPQKQPIVLIVINFVGAAILHLCA